MPLTRSPARLLGSLLAFAVLLPGCAPAPLGSPAPRIVAYDYFAAPANGDAWSPKIEGWQERERNARPVEPARSPASVSGSGRAAAPNAASMPDLGAKFVSFRAEQRRALARR